MPVLLLFVALPLIEIALFILIGSQLGVVTTLAIIILGALLGITILRGQKARAVAMMQGGMRVDAGTFLAQGAFRVVAGLLLILPGFLTDTIGLLLLIPPLQRALIRGISVRATVATGRFISATTLSRASSRCVSRAVTPPTLIIASTILAGIEAVGRTC